MKSESATTFDRIDRVVVKCSKILAWIGAAALFFTAIISTVNIIATKVFGNPISNVTELVTYLNIPIVFFCIAYVQMDHGHTHIDLIYRRFPLVLHKVIHIIGYLIGVAACGFAGWRGIALAVKNYKTMVYASGPSSFLVWPFVVCIGVGYLALALCFLWCIPRELKGRSPYHIDEGGIPEEEEESK